MPSRDQIVSDVLELIADESLSSDDNDEFQLLRLAQALSNTAGSFGLFFAVCNDPRMSRILAGRLRDILSAGESLVEVKITGDESSLLDRLRSAPGAPAPLSVYGIERLLPSSEEQGERRRRTLQELQIRREQFRSLSRPLILWMPEYAYILIGQNAVDFWSWQSGAFFFGEKAAASAGHDSGVESHYTGQREAVSPSPLWLGQSRVVEGARKALREGQSVMMLGPRGIGKSTLALRLANELRSDFQDKVLFLQVPAGGDVRASVKNALRSVIQAAHPDVELSDDLTALVSLYRHAFGGSRTLIVLDDVESPDVVRALLPTPPGSALLVTSNRILPAKLPGVRTFVLDRLTPEEARELLLGIAPKTSPEAADEICSLCDYMPLAIHLAGGLLSSERSIRPDTLIKLLREEGRADSKREASDAPDMVAASLRVSYKLLRPDTARVLRQLSVFPTSFDMQAAQAVCGHGSPGLIDELSRRALVIFHDDTERFVLHPLARSFAAAVSDDEERAVAAARHATHYEAVLRYADERYQLGGSEVQEALNLFDLEWENIQAGQAWASAHYQSDAAMAELCIAYPISGRYLLELRQPPDLRIRWIEAALAAARKLGREEAKVVHLYALGLAYEGKGDYRRAISLFEEALSVSRRGGLWDVNRAAIASLGRAYQRLGETQRAVDLFEQALAAAKARGDLRSESTLLNNLGGIYVVRGEAHRAIEYFEQALDLARKVGNRRNEAAALGSLGNAYQALGEYRKAIDILKQAMTASRELGFKHGEATSLNNIALAHLNLGAADEAVEATGQALRIFREIGDRHGEARALGNLGLALAEQGRVGDAIKHYEQQLVIDREIGDRNGEASVLGNLGTAYSGMGEHGRAIKLFEQALGIFREIGNRYGEASALSSLASTYETMGDHTRAIDTFERAFTLARETNNAPQESILLHNIGNVYTKLGDLPRALEYYNQALNNFRQIGNRRHEALALNNISLTLYDLGRRNDAIKAAEKALKIHEQIKEPPLMRRAAEAARSLDSPHIRRAAEAAGLLNNSLMRRAAEAAESSVSPSVRQIIEATKTLDDARTRQATGIVGSYGSPHMRHAIEAAALWRKHPLSGFPMSQDIDVEISPKRSSDLKGSAVSKDVKVEVLLNSDLYDSPENETAEDLVDSDDGAETSPYEFNNFPLTITLIHNPDTPHTYESAHRLRKPTFDEWKEWSVNIERRRRYYSPAEIAEHNAQKAEDDEDAVEIWSPFYSEWEANELFYNKLILEIAGAKLDEDDDFPTDQFRQLAPEVIENLRFEIKNSVITRLYRCYCGVRKPISPNSDTQRIYQNIPFKPSSFDVIHVLRKPTEDESFTFRTNIVEGYFSTDEEGREIIQLKLNLATAIEFYNNLLINIENAMVGGKSFSDETRGAFLEAINPVYKLRVLEPLFNVNAWYFKIDDWTFP